MDAAGGVVDAHGAVGAQSDADEVGHRHVRSGVDVGGQEQGVGRGLQREVGRLGALGGGHVEQDARGPRRDGSTGQDEVPALAGPQGTAATGPDPGVQRTLRGHRVEDRPDTVGSWAVGCCAEATVTNDTAPTASTVAAISGNLRDVDDLVLSTSWCSLLDHVTDTVRRRTRKVAQHPLIVTKTGDRSADVAPRVRRPAVLGGPVLAIARHGLESASARSGPVTTQEAMMAEPIHADGSVARRRRPTRTSAFGVGRREAHDATPFYERFDAPDAPVQGPAGRPPPGAAAHRR